MKMKIVRTETDSTAMAGGERQAARPELLPEASQCLDLKYRLAQVREA